MIITETKQEPEPTPPPYSGPEPLPGTSQTRYPPVSPPPPAVISRETAHLSRSRDEAEIGREYQHQREYNCTIDLDQAMHILNDFIAVWVY